MVWNVVSLVEFHQLTTQKLTDLVTYYPGDFITVVVRPLFIKTFRITVFYVFQQKLVQKVHYSNV
mgnify:CR=1 FL=1